MIADVTLRRVGWSERSIAYWGDLVRAGLAALALGSIAAFVTIDSRILADTVSLRYYSDFGLFYSQAVLGAQGGNPYGPVIRPGRDTPDSGKNLNPPHFHVLMRPLTWFSPPTAFALWIAGWVAAVTISVVLTYRALGVHASASVVSITVLAALASAPTITILMTGQLSPLLTFFTTWAWLQSRRGRWKRAAIALGLAASIKPFLGLFLPYLAVRRHWQAARWFVAAVAVPWAAGVAVFGWTAVVSYVSMLASVTWTGNVMNGSILGVWERTARGTTKPWELSAAAHAEHLPVTLLWLVLSVGVVSVTLWTTRNDEVPPDVDRAFLLLTTAALLVSPLGWSYYYWLFVGPLIAVIGVGWQRLSRTSRLLVWLAIPGLLIPPGMLTHGQPSGIATVTIGSLYFWSLVGVWGATLVAQRGAGVRAHIH